MNVKNISKYGFSFELLQKNIEYTHGKNGALGIDLEIVILMKNNRKISIRLNVLHKKSKGNYKPPAYIHKYRYISNW